jgi:hypothetical protein
VPEHELKWDGYSIFQSLGWKVSVCIVDEYGSSLSISLPSWPIDEQSCNRKQKIKMACYTYRAESNTAIAIATLPTTCIPTPKP